MVYVQAVDNKFYGNPVIYNDTGLLTFEDEEATITTRKFAKTSKVSGILRARQSLTAMGIKTQAMKYRSEDRKALPPKWIFYDTMSFNFTLSEPLPIPIDYESITADPPLGCPMICFYIQMAKQRLLQAIDNSSVMDRTLMNLLLDVPFHIVPTLRVKDELRKLIRKQFPNLEDEIEEILRVNKA